MGKLKLIYAKYDKSRIEILSSAVFYLPRDMPVEDFYGPGTQEKNSLRALAAKALTVEWAARIHRVPLDEFLEILQKAIQPAE